MPLAQEVLSIWGISSMSGEDTPSFTPDFQLDSWRSLQIDKVELRAYEQAHSTDWETEMQNSLRDHLKAPHILDSQVLADS